MILMVFEILEEGCFTVSDSGKIEEWLEDHLLFKKVSNCFILFFSFKFYSTNEFLFELYAVFALV